MKEEFIPILLGSDINAYGMAIQFYEEYNVTSIGVAKKILPVCNNTKLIKFEVLDENIEDNEVFVNSLKKVKEKYSNTKLLLVPCGDNYLELLVNNQEKLKKDFYFSVLSKELFEQMNTKEKFYQMCSKHNMKYPKTIIVDKKSWKKNKIDLDYPIIIKASNSPMYWNCSFKNKRKVFIAKTEEEKNKIIEAIYTHGYTDTIICQEFIPGDDSKMVVVNAYVGKDNKVKYISSGKILLEECTPEGIGSYAAIINEYNEKVCEMVKKFLEDIKYQGFANFDIKYNELKDEYNFFEINMRQGRSSYYVYAAGENFAKCLVDDTITNKKREFRPVKNKILYSIIPNRIIYNYVADVKIKKESKELIKSKKRYTSYYYKKDKNLKRYIKYKLNQINYYRKYKKYFSTKGEYEE